MESRIKYYPVNEVFLHLIQLLSPFLHTHLPQGGCKGLVRTIEPGPELAANAFGQLGGTEALNGFLGHLPLPFQRDGRRAHPCDALDDLPGQEQ